jgi:glutamate-1-semialdehyde 2,1-aminomutase
MPYAPACPLSLKARLILSAAASAAPLYLTGPPVALYTVSAFAWLCLARAAYLGALTVYASAWTPKIARMTAPFLPKYSFSEEGSFYLADGAPVDVVAKRRAGMDYLTKTFERLSSGKEAQELNAAIKEGLSDIRFTDTNRVPFPFQAVVRSRLSVSTVVKASEGPWLIDAAGNRALDVSGSYGVNVCGYDRYKAFAKAGVETCASLGPNVLGPLHPVIAPVIASLRKISGLEEVSFHMSGTEAVMCAVRLARFNTRRPLIVVFSGAYHGWWDGVQPGPGSERPVVDVLCLKDMAPESLSLILQRSSEIAAVLVSPLQGLNPNASPPSDMVLMDSKMRKAEESVRLYTAWLRKLQAGCNGAGVPLIFDEVYTGFRMAPGGAQQFYGVQADMVVYGKTLGGGTAVGVVCGKRELMRRFDPNHPVRVAYVIGTFSAAPLTLGCMHAFLQWAQSEEGGKAYAQGQTLTDEFITRGNKALVSEGFPLRLQNLTTVWTVLFTTPGRYHWLFQYYLRAEGVALSWVGTGRCLFSLDFAQADYDALLEKLLAAARRMRDDGWWYAGVTSQQIKRRMGKEFGMQLLGFGDKVKAV